MLLHRGISQINLTSLEHNNYLLYSEDVIVREKFKSSKEIVRIVYKAMSIINANSNNNHINYSCEENFLRMELDIVENINLFLYSVLGYDTSIPNVSARNEYAKYASKLFEGEFIEMVERNINYCVLSNRRFMKLILVGDDNAHDFNDVNFLKLDISSKNKLHMTIAVHICYRISYVVQSPSP